MIISLTHMVIVYDDGMSAVLLFAYPCSTLDRKFFLLNCRLFLNRLRFSMDFFLSFAQKLDDEIFGISSICPRLRSIKSNQVIFVFRFVFIRIIYVSIESTPNWINKAKLIWLRKIRFCRRHLAFIPISWSRWMNQCQKIAQKKM